MGMHIERDLYFKEKKSSEVIKKWSEK
jgi:hypothetical protein